MNDPAILTECLREPGPATAALAAGVRRGAPAAELAERLRAARPELGMSAGLDDGIHTGLSTGQWDDAVAAFGDELGSPSLAYLGPMLAREGQPASTGLLLGERDAVSAEHVETIEAVAEQLGAGLFGFACRFHDRRVEFYDVTQAAGSLEMACEAPIALFTPFYFAGWSDTGRQAGRRRTVLFGNVVRARFRRIAATILAEATVDGAPPALPGADEQTLRGAVAVWLTLHELMHGSGPAPFFDSWTGKSGIDAYGVIEEARVDMSAFLAAGLLADMLPEAALARELIVAERLFRSARRGLRGVAEGTAPVLDDEHGLCWLTLAVRSGAVESTSECPRLDLKTLDGAVRAALGEIYAAEQHAASADDPVASLRDAAPRLRRMLLTENGAPDPGPLAACYARHAGLPDTATIGAGAPREA